MTFPAELERLLKEATEGPWAVDPDDRPGMSWNNHIVQVGTPNTICFMAHDPRDNSGQEAAAQIICLLRNHADAILGLVRAVDDYEREVKNPRVDVTLRTSRREMLFAALAALNTEDKP